jgi:preprotein translocase subunit YajC
MGSLFWNLAGTAALFAEEAPPGKNQDSVGPLGSMLVPLVLLFMVFYFFMIRPQRREQTRRQAMLGAVKKNDRVVTIGGIYGVVANVHREADEVTLKVDEATNTKLRITLSSIARVLGDEPSGESATKET